MVFFFASAFVYLSFFFLIEIFWGKVAGIWSENTFFSSLMFYVTHTTFMYTINLDVKNMPAIGGAHAVELCFKMFIEIVSLILNFGYRQQWDAVHRYAVKSAPRHTHTRKTK